MFQKSMNCQSISICFHIFQALASLDWGPNGPSYASSRPRCAEQLMDGWSSCGRLDGSGAAVFLKNLAGRLASQFNHVLGSPHPFWVYIIGIGILLDIFSVLWVVFSLSPPNSCRMQILCKLEERAFLFTDDMNIFPKECLHLTGCYFSCIVIRLEFKIARRQLTSLD